MKTPIDIKQAQDGVQMVYRFTNGYGASVVKHSFSYGGDEGLWELAVIKYSGDGEWGIVYDTGITDDVIGYLTLDAVNNILQKIEDL